MKSYKEFMWSIPEEWKEDVDAIIERWDTAVDLAEYLGIDTLDAYGMLEREGARPMIRGGYDG